MSDNPFKKMWDRIVGWTKSPANKYTYVQIPKARTDTEYSEDALVAMRSYFRLWLTEMFLTNRRKWFTEWYPAVQAQVQLKFGDRDGVNFSKVAAAPQKALAEGVLLNYRLTELMPFNGGVLEMEAALLGMKGTNYLVGAIDILQDFSGLITAPLGQVLDVAEKVSNGIDKLLGATDGNVHLAFHQSLTSSGGGGANDLIPGYMAVILADAGVFDQKCFNVKKDQLYYGTEPFRAYDYMLLRVEGREERDDWRLKNIEEPLNKAITALVEGETEKAAAYKKVAIATALQSPDLAVHDRRRVVQAIKDELQQIESDGLGAVGQVRDLEGIVDARAMPVNLAISRGEMTFEEAFAN